MSLIDAVKRVFGVRTVSVAELNRRATAPAPKPAAQPPRDPLEGIVVTPEYLHVVQVIETGCPVVFVTGNAGTGKSTLIHYLRHALKDRKRLAVIAPTGVAALNVEGETVHSFFHLPPRIHSDDDIRLVADRRLYQKLDLLVIDEVSMVRCDVLDSVDKFLRKNRESETPFGGVQLLLVGDLCQLPPVVTRNERAALRAVGYKSPFFFSSFSLQRTALVYVELTVNYRQDDEEFIRLLNAVRVADELDRCISIINSKCGNHDGAHDITLTSRNAEADAINAERMRQLQGHEFLFMGTYEGDFHMEDRLPAPLNLKLKAGAHVMFTKNDAGRRWVNGSLGVVHDVGSNSIRVAVGSSASVHDVQRESWDKYRYVYDAEGDRIVAERTGRYIQFPLMLAWAVTIHKCQGRTLDKVLIDLGSGAFASGQVYVALSRCRQLEGIRLARPIRPSDIKCNPMVQRFYSALADLGQPERTDGQAPNVGAVS